MKLTEKDLPKLAKKIAQKLQPGDVLVLSGPLAAGKTTLTKAIVAALGYTGRVTSPTFVLERQYPLVNGPIKTVSHLDFYRLNPKDLAGFDWHDYLGDPNRLTIIEWPEIAEERLPATAKKIKLEIIDDQTRAIVLPDNLSY